MRYFIDELIVDEEPLYILKKQKQLAGIDNYSDLEVVEQFNDAEEAIGYANENNLFPLAIN